MRAITIAVALCTACTHAPPPRGGPKPLAIVGATVVFPERDTGTTLGDATVVIAGDRITAVGRARRHQCPMARRCSTARAAG